MFKLGNAKKNMLSKKEKSNKYLVDNYDIDLTNNNDSHALIINNIKGKKKKILDVGCGVGYIGRKLKSMYNCSVDGIEIDKDAYAIVKKYYDNAYNFSIENTNDKRFIAFINDGKKYDYIIFADLLEHLNDPGLIISRLYKKLTDDGKMIISIPNVAHIDIISNLIDGKFNYNKTGILDSTHLRFFTERSFYEFIANVSKKYNIELNVKILAKTYAKGKDKNDNFLFDIMDMDCYVFQNIFEISKTSNGELVQIDELENYKKINDLYLLQKKQISKYETELENEREKNRVLMDELNHIKNSRSWKAVKQIEKIKKNIK